MNLETVLNWPFEDIVQSYSERDSILYALGVGLGTDPTDRRQLRYLYEGEGFAALPTMPAVLCHPGMWTSDPRTGIVRARQVHGEQGVVLHTRVPPKGCLRGRTRVTGVVDKGAGRGALLYTERVLHDEATGAKVATLSSTSFCRGNGGFGGPAGPVKRIHPLPERLPDRVVEWPTLPQAALIYRLSGDRNPLHADPDYAARAGFEKPIMHGLATFGLAGWIAMLAYCDGSPGAIASIDARFSAPFSPGDTLVFETWRDGSEVSMRARSAAHGKTVLDNVRIGLA